MKRFSMLLFWLGWTSLGGCSFDVFHDTSWKTACDFDPSTPGCEEPSEQEDAGSDGSADTSHDETDAENGDDGDDGDDGNDGDDASGEDGG